MRRLLKALPLTLTIAAVSIAALTLAAAGCGSNSAQVRVINAIDDLQDPSVDVYVNGTDKFSGVGFTGYLPTQSTAATYTAVSSGTDTIQVYNHGATAGTGGFFSGGGAAETLKGSTDYTLLLAGEYNANQPAQQPNLWLIDDDNTAPSTGYMEIRVLNGSIYTYQQYTSGVDVYFVPQGQTGLNGTCSCSGLTVGQGTGYVKLQEESSYTITVTPHNLTNTILSQTYPTSSSGGQIFTIVLVDNSSDTALATPLLITDRN